MNTSTKYIHILDNFKKNSLLIKQMTKRDIAKKFRGSAMGILWILITPLVMLAIYGFVFIFVFEARIGVDSGTTGQFAILLFSGIIIHGFAAEILNRSPSTILENSNFVKKVIFPLEILPLTLVLSSIVQLLIGIAVLILGVLIIYNEIHLTLLWIPIIIIPYLLLMLGISWGLSAIGVFIRDISQITSVLATIMLFLSPVFYDISTLPNNIQFFIYLNPISFIVEQVRNVSIYGTSPDLYGLFQYTVVSIVILIIGYKIFQKTRNGFADIL